jgi:Na+-transporting methylmalonyl-CoA/oxaloacetate decarboxylase gamma subunit
MMADISGVSLTLMGMGVVFSALILLALAAWILERIFRAQPEKMLEKGGEKGEPMEAIVALALAYYLKKKHKKKIDFEGVKDNMWIQQSRVYE